MFRLKEQEESRLDVFAEEHEGSITVYAENSVQQRTKLFSLENGNLWLEKLEEWALDYFDNQDGYLKVLE